MGGLLVVVEVQFGELLPYLADGVEVIIAGHPADAWQLFVEVVGEGRAVVGVVEVAIDVIEDRRFGDVAIAVAGAGLLQGVVGYAVPSGKVAAVVRLRQYHLRLGGDQIS